MDATVLQSWVGRSEIATDELNQRLVASFAAIFDESAPAALGDDVPLPGIHWCLAPTIALAGAIGPDGHPLRGSFLPPIPLPRRMVAGGKLTILDTLRLGDAVSRTSTIRSITLKEGRSGPLCFLSVEHRFGTERGPAVVEQQDLVYRGVALAPAAGTAVPAAEPPGRVSIARRLSPVDLFRYSALTFNSHRIHYDQRYAVEVEGYPGLLVHGTLQAILLMRLAVVMSPSGRLASFAFRNLAPLFDAASFTLNGDFGDAGMAKLWIASAAGRHMEATAEFGV